ncbi:uncharacterized protein LOC134741435 [Cydia strobilella]|uniref:uncharacterized protein LOC134741435 n=1 Tax=Cydia strobilella TaxID=1100964 RepID=UPI003007C68E
MMGKVLLENIFKNLKMDSNLVAATKAKEYLAVHKEFRSDSSISASEQLIVNNFNNRIFCLQRDTIEDLFNTDRPELHPDLLTDRSNGLKKLVEEIEQNIDLICELEYLIRSIPVRETKHSIHLILQHLRFSSETKLITAEELCLIRNNTPLLAVGCYFQSLKLYEFSYFYATNETAIICHLITKLCQNVGLDCLKLVIGEADVLSTGFIEFTNLFHGLAPEVTGIITEKSDVDSAVDIFLNSEHHPFQLSRIFVQESIYTDFKDIIAWKCRSQQNTNIIFKSNCTDAFKYEKKTFYLDYAGNIEKTKNQNDQLVFVEAFRTINELLSLLNKFQKHLCLSIWASGVSEANEIALNVDVPIIWINDYCKFDGPPEVSQAIFDKTYLSGHVFTKKEIIEHLSQHQKAWEKEPFIERYEKVIKAFEMANQDIGNVLKAKTKSYWKNNNYIAVQDKTMIMVFSSPIPLISFYWTYELSHNINHPKMVSIWLSFARALINGSSIGYRVMKSRNDDLIADLLKSLSKFGLPLTEIENTDSSNLQHKMTYSYYAECFQTKVIWTSYGTTFAN